MHPEMSLYSRIEIGADPVIAPLKGFGNRMQELRNAFITKPFLRSVWALDYEAGLKAFGFHGRERQAAPI
jgi:hypothetical protein